MAYDNPASNPSLPQVSPYSHYAGGIASGIASLLSRDPTRASMDYLNELPGMIKPYYDPYLSAGSQAIGQQMGQYNQLLNDPASVMNQIGQSYSASPGYQFQVDQANRAAANAAAMGGMAGSGQHQQLAAQTINGIANQDYYNYLGKALGLYGQGLQGIQGVGQMGFGAASDLSGKLADNLNQRAYLNYSGNINQNMQQAAGLGGFGAGLGGFLSNTLGKWLGG